MTYITCPHCGSRTRSADLGPNRRQGEVLQYIYAYDSKGVSRTDIMVKFRLRVDMLNDIINVLASEGLITQFVKSTNGRPATAYRAKSAKELFAMESTTKPTEELTNEQ